MGVSGLDGCRGISTSATTASGNGAFGKGGMLEGLKIPLHKFVLALKLFELEVPAL